MKKQQKDIDQSRRNLIKGMGSAAIAGAVGATVSHSAAAKETAAVMPKSDQDGYHETQHIRDYYDTL